MKNFLIFNSQQKPFLNLLTLSLCFHLMKLARKYFFLHTDLCNMCGSHKTLHKKIGLRLNGSQGLRPHKKSGVAITVKKCTVCGLIFPDPMPIPETIVDHYNISPDKYWKEEYFIIRPDYFHWEISIIQTLIPFRKGMKSLDIGAGLGKQMLALEHAGFDAWGIEPSPAFYEMATQRMHIPETKLLNVSLEQAKFEKDMFDFISFGAVLEHLYDPSGAIAKAIHWLKPGGIIHIEVPSAKWLISKIINTYYKFTCQGFVTNISPMHEPFHLYEFTKKAFQLNAERLNYSIKQFNYFVCDTYLPKALDVILKPIMRQTNTGMQMVVWIQKH